MLRYMGKEQGMDLSPEPMETDLDFCSRELPDNKCIYFLIHYICGNLLPQQ